jgi:hypothetical protein
MKVQVKVNALIWYVHGPRRRERERVPNPNHAWGAVPTPDALVVPLRTVLAGIHAQILGYSKGYGSERGYIISSSGDVDVDAVDVPFDRKDEPDVDFRSPSLTCSASPLTRNELGQLRQRSTRPPSP